MTGFNVNCNDCSHCCVVLTMRDTYYCELTGDEVDIINNIDCCNYEPIITTNDE